MSNPFLEPAANVSSSTISTNATADGLVGPGRTLGLLLHFIGRRIESRLNRIALSRGHGPEAAVDRMKKRIWAERWSQPGKWDEAVSSLLAKGELVEDCQKLLQYARSVPLIAPINQ